MSDLASGEVAQTLPPYKFFASTVTLITSQCEGKQPNIMACEWTWNICWQPLRIMVMVHKDEYTHEVIAASGEFGVNLCSDQQAALAHFSGSRTGREHDKLSDPIFADLIYSASRIKAPMIRNCVLNAECVVEQTIGFGEYTGYVGRAVAARANPKLRPLFYHQGQYARLGEWIPKPNVTTA